MTRLSRWLSGKLKVKSFLSDMKMYFLQMTRQDVFQALMLLINVLGLKNSCKYFC